MPNVEMIALGTKFHVLVWARKTEMRDDKEEGSDERAEDEVCNMGHAFWDGCW